MLFLIIIIVAVPFSPGESRPAFEEDNEKDPFYISSKKHFPPIDKYKDLQLPPVDNSFNIILRNDGSGNYYSSFRSFDFERAEQGFLKNAGTDKEAQVVIGQYTEKYFDRSGTRRSRTIGYIADENGYQPFLIDVKIEIGGLVYERPQQPFADPSSPGAPKGTGIGSGCFEAACQFG